MAAAAAAVPEARFYMKHLQANLAVRQASTASTLSTRHSVPARPAPAPPPRRPRWRPSPPRPPPRRPTAPSRSTAPSRRTAPSRPSGSPCPSAARRPTAPLPTSTRRCGPRAAPSRSLFLPPRSSTAPCNGRDDNRTIPTRNTDAAPTGANI